MKWQNGNLMSSMLSRVLTCNLGGVSAIWRGVSGILALLFERLGGTTGAEFSEVASFVSAIWRGGSRILALLCERLRGMGGAWFPEAEVSRESFGPPVTIVSVTSMTAPNYVGPDLWSKSEEKRMLFQ